MTDYDRYVKALSRFVGGPKDRPEYQKVMLLGGHLYATNGIICARAAVDERSGPELTVYQTNICQGIDRVIANLHPGGASGEFHADFDQLAKVAKAWRDIHGGRCPCGARLYPCRNGLTRIDMRCAGLVVAILGMAKI